MITDRKTAFARTKREEKVREVVPPPSVPQTVLDIAALKDSTFPASPKRAWKKALASPNVDRCAMTYSVGPYMGAGGGVLQRDVPSLALWVALKDERRLGFWWVQRDSWAAERVTLTARGRTTTFMPLTDALRLL